MRRERIIILAADNLEQDGTFANFKDGLYAGGQVRMEAAVKIVQDRPEAEITLVGGYDTPAESMSMTSSEVNDMIGFMRKHCPHAMLQPIYSLPCTHHNFVAVFNTWATDNTGVDRISILTNNYHLARARAFAQLAAASFEQYAHVQIELLDAEEILAKPIESIVGDRHDEYTTRLQHEEIGLKQLEDGTYKDSCLTRNRESLQPILTQHGALLLTKNELHQLPSIL